MWMMTSDGFYSAVEHRNDPNKVMVRARSVEDLTNLLDAIGANGGNAEALLPEKSGPYADYEWRITLPRLMWAEYCAGAAARISYDNFKTRIGQVNPDRVYVYMNVWSDLRDIADEPNAGNPTSVHGTSGGTARWLP